jgi:EAL domain-containing protein (putative c-di-GMP-specific phosphodiesterase class I)
LLAGLSLELVLAMSVLLPLLFGLEPWGGRGVLARIATIASVLLLPVVLHAAWSLVRQQQAARNPDPRAGREGFVLSARHRGGRSLSVELVGRRRFDREGRGSGFEGIALPLDGSTAESPADQEVRARLDRLFATRTLITAFQPIRVLGTGEIIGAEALTRFVSSPFRPPDRWFDEADSIGRGLDLEFLALETALLAAAELPDHLYVAVNLSPPACLDPRLSDIVRDSGLEPGRIVVELTERSAVADYARLAAALAPLRSDGLRIAIDDVGAGFSCMRHILRLSPELIKLDRTILAGIDNSPSQRALYAAMVSFSSQIGASLVAEGIETTSELATVTELGVKAGQGYLLGRPSVLPADWSHWRHRNRSSTSGNDDFHDI